jgi:CRP-like cAMP-binding protein
MKTSATGATAIASFTGLNYEQSNRALKYFEERTLENGQEVFRKGEAGNAMAIIDFGKISVLRNNIEIAIIGKGRAFGEISMLDGRARTATCVATEPTKLLLIDSNTLRKMIGDDPDLAARLLLSVGTSLAGRLRRVDDKLAELVWGEIGY